MRDFVACQVEPSVFFLLKGLLSRAILKAMQFAEFLLRITEMRNTHYRCEEKHIRRLTTGGLTFC